MTRRPTGALRFPPGLSYLKSWAEFLHYNLQFLLEGGYISVDGKPYHVRYLDETHFDIAGTCYHICQFGERVIDRGRDVRKMEMEG